MASKNGIAAVDEDWIGKTKLPDTFGDLLNLFFGMGPRIPGIGQQGCGGKIFYRQDGGFGWGMISNKSPIIVEKRNCLVERFLYKTLYMIRKLLILLHIV
jgi:hypothetical protein